LKIHSDLDKVKDYILRGNLFAERQFKERKFDDKFPDIDKETLPNYEQSL